MLEKEIFYLNKEKNKIDYIKEYDKETQKLFKIFYYCFDGKTIMFINEYDEETQMLIKETNYYFMKEKIHYISKYEYNKKLCINVKIKDIFFLLDGKTINYIKEYDKEEQRLIRYIKYYTNGQIECIQEYLTPETTCFPNTEPQILIKETFYRDDGKIIHLIKEYDKGDRGKDTLIKIIDEKVCCQCLLKYS
ncbi:DUF2963 domain-containing protein [Candidatus Phytoplasma solani]|uniref:DUF2963 domain-containing protein n=1 Tax=Candidatus Phytoplasma solani TaxID=69896 RepID=UPI00358F5560